MKKILPLAFAGLTLFACREKQAEQPTIPEDKMARIMSDLSIAEAATMNLGSPKKDSLMQVYFAQVFQMHGTNLEEYEKNLRIYVHDLPGLERITKQVEDNFGEKK